MSRVLLGGLIVAIIAFLIGYFLWSRTQVRLVAERTAHQQQVSQLEQQRDQLADQNRQLKDDLAKVQSEQEHLAAANEELAKEIQQARLTGKLPPPSALPYPPK